MTPAAINNELGVVPKFFNGAMTVIVNRVVSLLEIKQVQEISEKVNNFVINNETVIFYSLMAISAVFELKMLALGIGIGYYANDKQITLREGDRSERTFTTAALMSTPKAKVISLVVTVFAYVIFNMSVMAFCFGFFTACYYTYKANAQINNALELQTLSAQSSTSKNNTAAPSTTPTVYT